MVSASFKESYVNRNTLEGMTLVGSVYDKICLW